MKPDRFDPRAASKKHREIFTPAPAQPPSGSHGAKQQRQYIEDVDDLDLYMKIYPEVKRRREEAERQVRLVEAEIKRREDLKFVPTGSSLVLRQRLLKLCSLMQSVVRNFNFPVSAKRRED